MSVTRDLFSIPSLSELKLLGGEKGLDHQMNWVYTILSQPFSNWVNYGDLIFYNAAGRDTSPVMLANAVSEARHCHLAGIIFLLDQDLLPDIPEEVIRRADDLELSVFSLPVTVSVNNIQKDIIRHIMKNNNSIDHATTFWIDALFSKQEYTKEEYQQNALLSGIDPKSTYYLYIIRFCNLASYCQLPVQKKQVSNPASILSGFYSRISSSVQHYFPVFWPIELEENCIVIVPADIQKTADYFNHIFQRITENLTDIYPGAYIICGKGSCITQLPDLKRSYMEAKRAMHITERHPEGGVFTDYARLGLSRILYEVPSTDILQRYVNDNISVLIEYDRENHTDYLEDLSAYFQNFGNMSQTAKQRNFHRNSMILRFEKIQDLLNIDLKEPYNYYGIYLAVQIYQYLQHGV